MKFLGNFNFIEDAWIKEVLNKFGQGRPRDWPPINAVESAEYARYKEAGYDLKAVNWWVYEKDNVSFDVNPPFVRGKHHWWITKLYPGQYMPMHSDPHTHEQPCRRYWIPLQDYEPGHIFIYKKQMMFDYKEGDVFSYEKSTDEHGAANIGHTPRVILQVTEYL